MNFSNCEEFSPAEEAEDILDTLFGTGGDATSVFLIARSGFHRFNPYHNFEHELQHVYWSHACAVNQPMPAEDDDLEGILSLTNLAVASLFHDHNHSGGKVSDAQNIEQALDILPMVQQAFGWTEPGTDPIPLDFDIISNLIRCTQFNGKDGFERDPVTFFEMCMRDADLMSVYTVEGRDLLMNLYIEMGTPLSSMTTSKRQEALEMNAQFLREAPMYTDFGQRMKEYHLEKALKDFADQVRDTL